MNTIKTISLKRISGIFLAIVLLLSITSSFAADPPPLTEDEKSLATQINYAFRRAVDQASPAVVSLQVSKEGQGNRFMNPSGLGSGCIIDPRGYIITNNHVVSETDRVEVFLADGRRFIAQEKMVDPDTDLAIVRIDPQGEKLPVAKFGDSDELRVGDFVLAIGNPFGLDQTVTAGIVSFRGRQTNILGKWGYEDFIQTDAAINKGNSGGPLVNLYGEVVGVNSNILSPTGTSTGYGFSIPSKIARYVSDQLIEKKVVKRGWLGISMRGITDIRKIPEEEFNIIFKNQPTREVLKKFPADMQGVLIIEVLKDSPAHRGGMENNDIILKINNKKASTSRQLQNIIARLEPETVVECLLWRDGKELTVSIELGDRKVAQAEDKAEQERLARRPRERFHDDWPFWPWQQRESEEQEIQPEKPYILGIDVQVLKPETAGQYGYETDTQGIVIGSVHADSLAEQCGLQIGDIVVSVNGEKIQTIKQLQNIVSQANLKDKGMEMVVRNLKGQRTCLLKRGAD
jgi:serine protease Do